MAIVRVRVISLFLKVKVTMVEESHGDYVAEDGTEQLLDDNLLSPAATSSLSILLDLCYHQREIRYYF